MRPCRPKPPPFDPAQLDRIERKLDAILLRANLLIRETYAMATNLDEITAEVQQTTDAQAAAVLLLQDLKARLDSAGTDPVALKALSDQLGVSTDALAAAIVANTPTDTTTPPPTEPPTA
jgi:hypothetical protein